MKTKLGMVKSKCTIPRFHEEISREKHSVISYKKDVRHCAVTIFVPTQFFILVVLQWHSIC